MSRTAKSLANSDVKDAPAISRNSPTRMAPRSSSNSIRLRQRASNSNCWPLAHSAKDTLPGAAHYARLLPTANAQLQLFPGLASPRVDLLQELARRPRLPRTLQVMEQGALTSLDESRVDDLPVFEQELAQTLLVRVEGYVAPQPLVGGDLRGYPAEKVRARHVVRAQGEMNGAPSIVLLGDMGAVPPAPGNVEHVSFVEAARP